LRYLLLLTTAILTACAGAEVQEIPEPAKPQLTFESDRFGNAPKIADPHDIFRLTAEQRRAFLNYFDAPLRARIPANQRVYDYLETVTTDFNFRGDTLTAAVTLERGAGNCLSLAILTTALADLVDVEIDYQLMDSAPVFESQGQVIYKGVHARSILYDRAWKPEDDMFVVRRKGIRVDYFPSGTERFIGNLSRDEFIAMYYSNLAADSLSLDDYSSAFWLLNQSLAYAPGNDAAINMMAVVYRRAGDPQKAEEIYRYGIEHLADKVTLLRNYRILLNDQGRFAEADEVATQLERLGEPNPFDWIHAAQQAHSEGQYTEAISLYKKAVAIAPYLHESYFGMARSHYELGNRERAETELAQALERADRASTRSLYEAKLAALTGSPIEE
jgi:Tfp pilus assembly protein PilF